jgi:hypothetical protein
MIDNVMISSHIIWLETTSMPKGTKKFVWSISAKAYQVSYYKLGTSNLH